VRKDGNGMSRFMAAAMMVSCCGVATLLWHPAGRVIDTGLSLRASPDAEGWAGCWLHCHLRDTSHLESSNNRETKETINEELDVM
jgi:hypothetical protein